MVERKNYSKALKEKAVQLAIHGDKSNVEIERDLKITRGNLQRWVKEFKKDAQGAFPGKGRVTGKKLEILQLKKKIAELEEDKAILKKVMGIFSGAEK